MAPQPATPIVIASQPGIDRDNTRLSSQRHSDGEWVRFDKGAPRKMGGYSMLTRQFGGVSRGLHSASTDGTTYFHTGSSDRLEVLRVARDGSVSPPATRTPAGFAANTSHIWTFGSIYDVVSGQWKLIAHAAPNGLAIDSKVAGSVYIGRLDDTAVLTAVPDGASDLQVSGGIACIHPFMFFFGSDGQIGWSVSNKPGDVTSISGTGTNIPAGEARPTGAKVIAGRTVKGAVPGGLFWSLDTLLQATYVGGRATWDFNDISGIDILSAKSIVEFNGSFFWVGSERFQMLSGGVRDVPNNFNERWFFDNLNWAHSAKIYGFAIPARGEIWFCFPKGEATECTHAVILHVPTGNWWDTALPHGGRSAALGPTSTYRYPVMAGVDAESAQYRLWKHEYGFDEINGSGVPNAIRSYYVTGGITLLRGDKPSNASIEVLEVEPDFVQTGDLTMTVIGNANARAPDDVSPPIVIPESPAAGSPPEDQIIELSEDHRQLRFKFESNELGGNYEAGTTYAQIRPTGNRTTS